MATIPINSGTGPQIAVDTIGTQNFQVVKIMQAADGATASLASVLSVSGTVSVGTITTLLGTVAVSGGGGGAQYPVNSTGMGSTATGTVILGMQTGATTGRGIALTTSGQALVQISTGTMTVVSLTTGTVNVANTVTITGTVGALMLQQLDATNDSVSAVFKAHGSRFDAFVIATTSAAAAVIVKTSGAHTLYITDIVVSVSGPMNIQICSEITAKMSPIFLATNGGFVANYMQPLIMNSAQSMRVLCSSSGTCGVSICGYTFT